MSEMRRVDKRKWVCRNIAGRCSLSSVMSSAMYHEVPSDRKCPLCYADIMVFDKEEIFSPSSIMEIVPYWQCEACKKTGSIEMDRAPDKCPDCGGKISTPPVKKGGPLEGGLEKKG